MQTCKRIEIWILMKYLVCEYWTFQCILCDRTEDYLILETEIPDRMYTRNLYSL